VWLWVLYPRVVCVQRDEVDCEGLGGAGDGYGNLTFCKHLVSKGMFFAGVEVK
jgi:hypothetical protein